MPGKPIIRFLPLLLLPLVFSAEGQTVPQGPIFTVPANIPPPPAPPGAVPSLLFSVPGAPSGSTAGQFSLSELITALQRQNAVLEKQTQAIIYLSGKLDLLEVRLQEIETVVEQ